MNAAHHRRAFSGATATAFVILIIAPLAYAESNDAEKVISKLKKCVEKHMPAEKKKKLPKADNLLAKCQSEVDLFIQYLPPELVSEVLKHVRADIRNRMFEE